MKLKFFLCAIIITLAGPLYAQEGVLLKEKKDRMSYTIGVDIARTLKKQSIEVNPDIVKEAMRDVFSGRTLRLTEQEMADAKTKIEKDASDQKNAEVAALAEKNKKEEEKFLAENKKKEGVVTLPSGLQYKIIKAGTGKRPKEDDVISVHYRVMRLDESEIESSYKKPEPETFSLENVVPGWREGAILMPTGSKWRLFVPSKLAYGEDGVGEIIGPNTMLIFDLELIQILEKPAQEDLKTQEKAAEKTEAKAE
ncbi:MAG TPA: FKBP-type peptidyl-prolyl cis-trans isomerase [Syntrophorhabdaceae bacterium]|jgi:FKBP-type peptidyl-prolyl cis-trans isomerase FklB